MWDLSQWSFISVSSEFLNLSFKELQRYFVNPSARFSLELIYFKFILFSLISSLTWWYLMSICFDLEFIDWFWQLYIAALLSMLMVTKFIFTFNSFNMFMYHRLCFAHDSFSMMYGHGSLINLRNPIFVSVLFSVSFHSWPAYFNPYKALLSFKNPLLCIGCPFGALI